MITVGWIPVDSTIFVNNQQCDCLLSSISKPCARIMFFILLSKPTKSDKAIPYLFVLCVTSLMTHHRTESSSQLVLVSSRPNMLMYYYRPIPLPQSIWSHLLFVHPT